MKTYLSLMLCASCLLIGCGGGSSQAPPLLTITTASLPNGTSELPYNQTIQASGGVAPFTWTVSAGALPHNLALSSSTLNTVTISGTPDTAAQGVAFTIKITDSGNQSATQSYTVSILLEPDSLTLTPSGLDFGVQPVGTASAKQSDTLTNTGNLELVINSVATTGTNATDFNQSGTCGSSIAAGANCTINVTFTPSLIGPRSASVTITDNSMGSPHSLSLNGLGVNSGPNATLSATALTFPNEAVGTSSPAQSITLSNYGTAELSIASIVASANFGETTTCGSTLASGASCAINVIFMPSASGGLNGTISITDNAPGSPQMVSLGGIGVTGKCSIQGAECGASIFPPCCPGLVCVPASTRAFCEPGSSGSLASAGSSSWEQALADQLQ